MKNSIFNFKAKWLLVSLVLMFAYTSAWATTIASWGKVSIAASTDVTASGGTLSGTAKFQSDKAMTSEGTNAFYGGTAGGAVITFSGLTLTGYRNIKMTYYGRASKGGYFSVEYSTNGSDYYDLVSYGQVKADYSAYAFSGSEEQFLIEGIPATATHLKLTHSQSQGSLYFGTVVISGDLASECSEGIATGIAIGDTITFYESSNTKEMTAISDGRGTATGYSSAPEGTMKFVVEAGNASGTLSFKNGTKYLGMQEGGNVKLELQNSKTNSSSWVVDMSSYSSVEIKNYSYNTYFLKYNSTANQFSSYTTNATNTHWIKIYHPCLHVYNVTYDGNSNTGGMVPVDNTNYTTGSTVTVLGNTGTLTRTDCTFDGWNTAANGSGTSYAAGATFSITEDVTLYAKWTCTVTWMINGVEYTTAGPTRSVVAGNKVTVLPPNPDPDDVSCSGTDFMGWTATNMGADLGKSAPADLFMTAGTSPTITGNITFYAVFADPD